MPIERLHQLQANAKNPKASIIIRQSVALLAHHVSHQCPQAASKTANTWVIATACAIVSSYCISGFSCFSAPVIYGAYGYPAVAWSVSAPVVSGTVDITSSMRIKLSGLPLCKAGDWGLQTPEKCLCSGVFAAKPQKHQNKKEPGAAPQRKKALASIFSRK
jgi:hypothetical protein